MISSDTIIISQVRASLPVCVAFVILMGLHEVAFVIMIGLHISDLFWRSLVVEPDADTVVDTLDTDDGVAVLAPELAAMMVFVTVVTGVFVDDGVLLAGVFCTRKQATEW